MPMELDALIESRKPKKLQALNMPLKEICARYEKLYTGAVNDVLREHMLMYQALPKDVMPLKDDMVVAGEAFTVKGIPTLQINDDMRVRGEMLDEIYEDCVVIWDTTRDELSSQWGEMITATAKRAGCRGAVVDGGVRDTRQVLAQDFPVWVRYRTSNAMMGRFCITGWNVPIEIGRVHIYPGDLVMADIDGAVIVPRDLIIPVLKRSEEVIFGEAEIKKWVEDGVPVKEVIDRGGYF